MEKSCWFFVKGSKAMLTYRLANKNTSSLWHPMTLAKPMGDVKNANYMFYTFFGGITSTFKGRDALTSDLSEEPWLDKTSCSPPTHTEIQGSGPKRANRCHTCARTYDPLTNAHTHQCTSLKFQSGHSSSLTVKKGIWTFWQYIWSHIVTQYISHHFTEHVCLSVEDTLLLRVIMCHTSLFLLLFSHKI